MPQILLKIEEGGQAFGVFFVFSVMGPNLRAPRVQKGVPLWTEELHFIHIPPIYHV